jgi:hypothetical protein
MLLNPPRSILARQAGGVAPASEYITTLPPGYTSVGNVVTNAGTDRFAVFGYGPVMSGKKYWEEVRVGGNISNSYNGLIDAVDAAAAYDNATSGTGVHNLGIAWQSSGAIRVEGSIFSGFSTYGATGSDVLMFAYDNTTGNFWEGVNGVWGGGGPASVSGGRVSASFTSARVAVQCRQVNAAWQLNVAAGDLTYSPPAGFSPLI